MPAPLTSLDLRLTPYWWEAAPRLELPPAPLPEQTDVAVVGAGFAGLSAALTLARAGRDTLVFDALRAGEGASSRNGGICSGNIRLGFGQLIGRLGLEAAKRIYAEGAAARADLARFIEAEKIACGFRLTGRFTGAYRARDYERLGRQADLLNRHLDLGVEMVPRSALRNELGTDLYHGGQIRPDIGGLHPGLFHAGLLERALAAGAGVADSTRVVAVERETQGFTVQTERGAVRARDVIVATNGYTGDTMPWLKRRIVPIQSQIIATEPIGDNLMNQLMPKRRMLGETRNLYHYYRPAPDETCILFGGRAGANKRDPRQSGAHLYRGLIEIFPELAGVGLTHSWSGFTGYTLRHAAARPSPRRHPLRHRILRQRRRLGALAWPQGSAPGAG